MLFATVDNQWVATAASVDVAISGGPLVMGYNLKNLGTDKYFSWTFPNGRVPSTGDSLTTVSNTAVVNLLPHGPDGSYLILYRGKNATYPSIVYTDSSSSVVYGSLSYAGYTVASQYYGIGTPVRWVFEAAGKVSPPTIKPEFTSPIVKKEPLPKELYRIRSFTGGYLLTMPEKSLDAGGKMIPYVARQVPKNEYQRWQVTRQENGLYTISNSANGLYLAAPSSNLTSGALLLGQSAKENPKPFEWNIQSVNGVFFFVGVPTATLSMGFADYDAQESKQVALTASDNAASQIWLFETMKPLAEATFSHLRLLTPGAYVIELSQSNSYLAITDTDDLADVSARSQATRFQVIYKDEHTAKFTLSYRDSDGGRSYIIASASNGGRLETTDAQVDPTEWAALRLEPGDDVYHIVRADVQDPQRSISSRRIASKGKSYFAIDPLARDEVSQMFRLHLIV
ncbi:hypothetical protein D9613_010161 [Agrocybe pediades]|uniref:Ricin B lectin domain-containing protein n=1 Tax=Agrocybe pediades TaxID=84607 RepID=A0A8H4VQL8_9AGAR|nr:hypothetical protein D9613_010161 [Agrocybe pediades]